MQELLQIFDQLAAGSTGKQRAALRADCSVAVRAVAGSGKTRALALRYVQHLLCPDPSGGEALPPRQVAAITFTRKAAGELRRRVDGYLARAETLADEAGAREARLRVMAAREGLIEAPIGTIHSFCAALLREYALFAGLDPEFAVLDTRDAAELKDTAREQFWRELNAAAPHDPRRIQAIELAARYGMGAINALIDELVSSHNLYLFGGEPWMGGAPKSKKKRSQSDDPMTARREASLLARQATLGAGEMADAWERLCEIPLSERTREMPAAEHARAVIAMAGDMRERFDAIKTAHAALDFEDLERRAWELLRRNPGGVLDIVRRRIRRLLVDEFQDTSPVQWEIIRMIAGEEIGPRLFIVGDPQQSIFGFRNADLRIFHAAEEMIRAANPNATDGGLVAMNDNFRSRPEVLEFVNAVMPALQSAAFGGAGLPGARLDAMARSFQVSHLPMIPRLQSPTPGSVHLILHAREAKVESGDAPAESMEAEIIARRIRALVSGDTALRLPGPDGAPRLPEFADVAILVRTRDEFQPLETAFLHHDIPFHIIGGKGFFQTPEITDISMLLTVLSDPANDIALAGVLRAPLFGFPDTLLLRLTLAAPGEAATLWERLTAYDQLLASGAPLEADHPTRRGERLPLAPPAEAAAEEARLTRLAVENITRWRDAAPREPLPQLLHTIFKETGAWAMYRANGRQTQAVANLQKLIGLARAFEAGGAGALLEFVENLATLTREEEEEAEAQTETEHTGAVHMLTMHSAKGLEFPIVFAPRLGREWKRWGTPFKTSPDLGVAFRALDSATTKQLEKHGPVISPHDIIQAWNKYKERLEELRLFYVVCTRAEHHLFLSSSWPYRMPKPLDDGPANSLLGLLLQTPEFESTREWLSDAEARDGAAMEAMEDARIGGAALTVEWWRRIEAETAPDDSPDTTDEPALPAFFTPDRLAALQPLRLPPGEVRLSVSQAAMLSGCPRQWALYQLLGPAIHLEHWGEDSLLPAEEERGAESEPGLDAETPGRTAAPGDRKDYGNVCHKMFELLLRREVTAEVDEDALMDEAFRLAAPGLAAPQREAWRTDLRGNLAAFRESETGRGILASSERHAELPFILRREGVVVRGIIDALYMDSDGRWAVADYKTSRIAAENIPRSASRYVPQMALTAAFVLARFPGQDAVTATLYYPFPDRAVPMTFHRADIEADLAGEVAAWRAMLTAGELQAFPFAPDWLKQPQFARSLQRIEREASGAPAPRSEPCPSCPFLDKWCDLPEPSRRAMLARRAARGK